MPSSSPSGRARRVLQLFLVAALVVASRAPFLARADRFFDSDEAVEGLMARHVLQHGDHPAFLWGQRYKGVPEVYLTAVAFSVSGPSVVTLKSVTLACFAAFAVLQFVLVERLFATGVAWLATLFLIACPPSLVLWSLSANAEIVWTMAAGTALCLGVDVWRRTGSSTALMAAAAALGFGLWVQQFILYYVAGLGVAVLVDLPRRREFVAGFLRIGDMPAWARAALLALFAFASVYIVLGIVAFVGGGFDIDVGSAQVGVHHPQKLWRIGAALLLVCGAARTLWWLRRPGQHAVRRVAVLAIVGLTIGYLPAIAARAAGGGSSPLGRMDLAALVAAWPSIAYEIVPMTLGFRSPTTGWLGLSAWWGLVVAAALVASWIGLRRRSGTPLFHAVVVASLLVFVASGAYINAQSYRYLMPAAGALAVVMALGVAAVSRASRAAGVVLGGMLAVLFAVEQMAWYRTLVPDIQSAAILACLDRAGATAAEADYWLSYKLTFLSGERVIVAPNTGVDRYPPFRTFVRSQPRRFVVPATIGASSPCILDASSSR